MQPHICSLAHCLEPASPPRQGWLRALSGYKFIVCFSNYQNSYLHKLLAVGESRKMINLLKQIPVLRGLRLYKRATITNIFRIYLSTQPPKHDPPFKLPKAQKADQKILDTRAKDGIPPDYELIYNSYETHVLMQALSTLLISASSIGIGIHVYQQSHVFFGDYETAIQNIFLGLVFYIVQSGILILALRFPVRIYHNRVTKHYKAVRTSYVPFKTRVLDYTREDVRQIPPRTDFPWRYNPLRYCLFKIKEVDIYMHEEYFRYPADLVHMLPSDVHWRNLN